MSRIILLRHGQSRFNTGETDDFDSDVTERGNYQIQEGSLHVKEVMEWEWSPHEMDIPYTLFVSPLQRTLKTALPLYHRFGLKVVVDHRIGETPDDLRFLKVGPLPYRLIDFPTYDWSRYPQKGMCIHEISKEEYYNGLKHFATELPENAIVVSHMTTIKDLASVLTGLDLKDREVPNCSVTLIEDGQLVFIGKK